MADTEVIRLRDENARLRVENAALRPLVSELQHRLRVRERHDHLPHDMPPPDHPSREHA